MSRGACERDSPRGRGHTDGSGRVSDRTYEGGIEAACGALEQAILRLFEGIFGSSGWRAFLFFFVALFLVRHLIQVAQLLLPGSDGSLRKAESGNLWAQLEQHLESILGCVKPAYKHASRRDLARSHVTVKV
jgi:hypothetical protein